jgi:hypothetical protein
MKTVTEFSGSTLKQAAAAKAKLVGEGVAPEQLSERLGTDIGVTGDRLARLVEALEAAGDQVEKIRLMRVFAGTDEVKGAKKVGEFNYLVDLQPSMQPARGGRDRDRGRGGFGGRRGGGGGGGGGGFAKGPPGGAGGKGGPLGRDGLPREDRGPLQTAGAGWTLTRDPSAPLHDKKRGGPKRGGRPGDRRDRRGPGGPGGGPPGAEARGDRPKGPRPPRGPRPPGGPRPQGGFRPRPPGAPGVPGAPEGAVAAEGAQQPGGPAGEGARRRRRRRGRGGPFALQPSTAPGAAAALGIPTVATTGIDPNAAQPSGPPNIPGAPGQKKRRRRRGGRGRGPGAAPPMTGAPGQPAVKPAEGPENASNARPPSEADGNLRPPEPPPPVSADPNAPEPGNER